MSDALLTYKDLSVRTRLPQSTLRALVSRGKVPHLRIGPRTVRFDPVAIRGWLASLAEGGTR